MRIIVSNPTLRFVRPNGDSFDDWREGSFHDVMETMRSGGTPKSSNQGYYGGEIPFLSISDITKSGKYIDLTEKTITQEGLDSCSAWVVPKYSLILAMYASYGKVCINTVPMATSQALLAMIPKPGSSLEFFYQYGEKMATIGFWDAYVKSGTQPNLSKGTIEKIKIFIPSVDEQQKIADFFSALDKKIALAERKLSLQSRIRRGLEKGFFSRSISVNTQNQVPWKKYLLGDIAESFYSGSTPKSQMVKYYSGDIPWATSLDLNRNLVLSTGKCLSTEGFNSCNLKLLPKGSFVFSTCGVEAENVAGNCGILGMDSAISQSLMCIKPKESVVSSKFLFYWYRCFGREICKRYAHGTKQLHLNIDLMSDIEIQLPSLNEQNKIIEILDSIEEKYQLLEKEVLALRKLKQSLLQQMFI